MDISIVIPVFNEAEKISADIQAAAGFLIKNHLTGEIIIVDDGSADETEEVAQNFAISLLPNTPVKVLRYENHRGKGYAVRTGIAQTSGNFVVFTDSGSCVPYEYIFDGMTMIKNNLCDIAHGSRKMPDSKIKRSQNVYRRLCSTIFRLFLIRFMKISPEFTDTQCGFKIYRGDIARKLYSQCISDGFMFDIEILLRAQMQGYRIKEFPIEWSCDPDSRLSPTKSLGHILAELRTIRRTIGK